MRELSKKEVEKVTGGTSNLAGSLNRPARSYWTANIHSLLDNPASGVEASRGARLELSSQEEPSPLLTDTEDR